MRGDQKNVWLAMSIIIVMFFGWQLFYELPRIREQQEREARQAEEAVARQEAEGGGDAVLPRAEDPDRPLGSQADGLPAVSSSEVASGPRLAISTDKLEGSIALDGARFDDLTLLEYRTDLATDSPRVVLLSPGSAPIAHFAEFGWLGDAAGPAVPDSTTRWQSDSRGLTPESPATLRWDNGAGLIFERRIAIDEDYLFTIERKVVNRTSASVTLRPYGLISRRGILEEDLPTYMLMDVGPLGVFGAVAAGTENGEVDYTLSEMTFEELRDSHAEAREAGLAMPEDGHGRSRGGWLGFTDKYWLTALIPEQDQEFAWRFLSRIANPTQHAYQGDYLRAAMTVPPGGEVAVTDRLFAGAEVVSVLAGYEDRYDVPFFGRLVFSRADYIGGFYFITEPMFQALDWLKDRLGSFGLAILALTLAIKIVFFPLANKSYRSMSKMRKLAPEMQKLRERHKDDKAKMQQELMALYRKEKVNPASGCLPIVIQIPVFIALYQVLISTIEMRHAPFYGWIRDLSAPDPVVIWNLFGLLPFDPGPYLPAFLMIGIWPILMAGTMFLQQKISPTPPDPVQARIFLFMPVIFLFLFASFPAGLVIYWTWNNLLSIAQQWFIMKQTGAV